MGEWAETLSLLRADGLWDVREFEQGSRLGHHQCGWDFRYLPSSLLPTAYHQRAYQWPTIPLGIQPSTYQIQS